MCNNDGTRADWVPPHWYPGRRGGRAIQPLKSVIDVICSSQTLGLGPRREHCPDTFSAQQRGVLQHGRPRGTACFSRKPLDMNWSPWREKAHASASACLKTDCSLVAYSPHSGVLPLTAVEVLWVLPRQEDADSIWRTPSAGNAGQFLLSLCATLQTMKLKSMDTWQFPVTSQALCIFNFSGGNVSL